MRVLLVDDEPAILRTYAHMLEAKGATVDTASDGRAAVAKLAAAGDEYDVIVSDISMPGMGGIEFLRNVRLRHLDLPVVLITADPVLETAVKAIEYGAFRYLVKPVTEAVFTETVERASQFYALAKVKRAALDDENGQAHQLGDRASLEVRFEKALDGLWLAFQPITSSSTHSVFAYEALMRSDEPTLSKPNDILAAAERLSALPDVGRRVRELAASAVGVMPKETMLFINMHATDLNDADLFASGSPLSDVADRVVLEMTERASLEGLRDVALRIATLRSMGFRIAVDDLGAGYAGLSVLAQLEPDVVKLDMSLIRDVNASPTKQRVVRSMVQLSRSLRMTAVCEGVETEAECAALVGMECDLLQGFYFAKPTRDFASPAW